MWDGLVIGGGLAGLSAGIRAQQRGKKVIIVSEGTSSLMFASGGLDFGQVEQLQQEAKHPYAILQGQGADGVQRVQGQGVLEIAFDAFQELFPSYEGTWGQTRTMLTPLGTLRETSLLPHGLNAAPLFEAKEIILVEPEGLKDFFPEVVRSNLQKQSPAAIVTAHKLQAARFAAWQAKGKPVSSSVFAKFWCTNEGQAVLKQLLEELSGRKQADAAVIIFPSLCTMLCSQVDHLVRQASLPVVEISSFPPSPAGQGLLDQLRTKFKALGGEILAGAKVERLETEAGRARLAVVQSKGKQFSLTAKAFVLATGGLFGRGIVATPAEVQEMVCGLPLFVPAEWSRRSFLGEQPYAHTGIEVDAGLHPCEPGTGTVLLDNVLVAGRSLAHWDPWTQQCGGGVSLASGYRAGDLL